MSMEVYVLSDRKLDDLSAWQKAISKHNLSLVLDDSRALEDLRGFLPVKWEGAECGFECDHWPVAELFNEGPVAEKGRAWSCALAFRWGMDFSAVEAACAAAAAYAFATDGVVYDPQVGRVYSPGEMLDNVRKMVAERPEFEKMMAKLLADVHAQYKRD